jgi:hypothetical protein
LVEVQSSEKAEFEVEIERLDIRWDLFVEKVESAGAYVSPVLQANKIKVNSMKREIHPEEKIVKR